MKTPWRKSLRNAILLGLSRCNRRSITTSNRSKISRANLKKRGRWEFKKQRKTKETHVLRIFQLVEVIPLRLDRSLAITPWAQIQIRTKLKTTISSIESSRNSTKTSSGPETQLCRPNLKSKRLRTYLRVKLSQEKIWSRTRERPRERIELGKKRKKSSRRKGSLMANESSADRSTWQNKGAKKFRIAPTKPSSKEETAWARSRGKTGKHSGTLHSRGETEEAALKTRAANRTTSNRLYSAAVSSHAIGKVSRTSRSAWSIDLDSSSSGSISSPSAAPWQFSSLGECSRWQIS
jgi:hypothetical protein